MLNRIIEFSIRQRLMVILITIGMGVWGVFNFQKLPIDALPDITNIQVQINTEAVGYSPLEVEQRISFPLETALAGLPRLESMRSLSRYGLSQLTLVFEDGTDIYFARQILSNRLTQATGQLPPGIQPEMGPIATGLGEIFMWALKWKEGFNPNTSELESLTRLREEEDWIVRPQLRNVPGVIEVNTIGGYVKQIHVTPNPGKLMAHQLSFRDVLNALARNNQNVGSGFLEHKGEQYLIRTPGQVASLDDIRRITLGSHRGVPILIQDVAEVSLGKELRTGAATHNGQEVVMGTVFMLKGENSRTVSKRVSDQLKEIQKTLPEGMEAKTLYDRTKLVNATLNTVWNNLAEGALFVVLVLFLLLRHFRAALITALVIPLSMLFAITGMVENKISGNLLSLGAIDFGIIVDCTVIIVENCLRRLQEKQSQSFQPLTREERHSIVREASREVSRPSIFGVLIIMVVYLPILTLTGIEGKMFQPMAFTVLAALLGALLLSITFVPAMVAQFAHVKSKPEKTPWFDAIKNRYLNTLEQALQYRVSLLTTVSILLVACLLIAINMGREFLPTLDERDLAVHALRIPGTSLSQAVKMQHHLEKKFMELPEIDYIFSKIGTGDIATDPMPPSVADTFVILKPRKDWPDPRMTHDALIAKFESFVKPLPGNKYEFTQPIQMRFNELIAGVRADVAVKIHGDDMDTLHDIGERVVENLNRISGASDVRMEQVTGLPVLTIHLRREELSRMGLNISDVQDVIQIALGGMSAGQVFQGDRRFDLIVRLPENLRSRIDYLKRLPLPYPENWLKPMNSKTNNALNPHKEILTSIPLGTVADFEVIQGPNQISRENGKRRIVVTANVRERDLGSFIESAQNTLNENLTLPSGFWITWGGQFEHLISAAQRLKIVVPIALTLIFIFLFFAVRSFTHTLMIFTGVPLALTGGILFIWLRGIPLSISAAIGFIALSGVAVLNGLVLITFINKLTAEGLELKAAILKGCATRLRPILMTALVASLGFVPMALATGTGAEVQRPLATVVIGGILSSTVLTLFVLPALMFSVREKKPAPSLAQPTESVS
ncbi:MAG: CusA/CzcA family heavy metal efflux RND transporter [Candidatus Nitronauta litoralis]|uniref:CusA/CzcA family heavy metal efflux RND transporter n=1 Tax=Candidatus Nitronauta litoralis TaxID=2705533 RepID=A0A7T0BVF0_9BACT|nr:MAG: CusA/CzcA family heavy metal efflux RND transporter [Candidatus Nitronauta litoralis]